MLAYVVRGHLQVQGRADERATNWNCSVGRRLKGNCVPPWLPATLNQLGLLQRCRVLSTVSDGSVIGAMYVTHSGSFEEFEADVQVLLRRGLAAPSLVTALITTEGLRAILCMLLLVAAQCIILPLRWVTVLLSVAMRREVG